MSTTTQMFSFNTGAPVPPAHAHCMVAGIDSDGIVYASGGFHPNGEHVAALCAAHDGTPIVEQDGHMYLPADWLASEIEPMAKKHGGTYSRLLETLENIRTAVHEAAHESTSPRTEP